MLELLPSYMGKLYVTHSISNTGVEAYLTPPKSFAEEAVKLGGVKLNTVETDTKHVLFVFNQNNKEVKRYYLGKTLQGKSPQRLAEIVYEIITFDAYNPIKKEWVPCVRLFNPKTDFFKKGYGLTTILGNNRWYVLDQDCNYIVVPGKYNYIDGFDTSGFARVKINGYVNIDNPEKSTRDRWGIIDFKGREVLPVIYSEIWSFYNKGRISTKVYEGLEEDGHYYPRHREYRFEFKTCKLIDVEDERREWEREQELNSYSVLDALDGEPEAWGNLGWDW